MLRRHLQVEGGSGAQIGELNDARMDAAKQQLTVREAVAVRHRIDPFGNIGHRPQHRLRALADERQARHRHRQVGVLHGARVHVLPDHRGKADAGRGVRVDQQALHRSALTQQRENANVRDDATFHRQGTGVLPITAKQTEHVVRDQSRQ